MQTDQLDLFGCSYPRFKPKKIRLIELFAGIGAQAKALELLGADFEPWITCEWSWKSILAYAAIHGDVPSSLICKGGYLQGISADYSHPMTDAQIAKMPKELKEAIHEAMEDSRNMCPDISRLHGDDLCIVHRDDFTYVMTYSFPCQDLSVAGNKAGMDKGSNTRSGLLWEVERILNELYEKDNLPQVLLMENVTMVHGKGNVKAWNDWLHALEDMGYTNYFRDLEANDFGLPQGRVRCFMVSILGKYEFQFPKKMPLIHDFASFLDKHPVEDINYLPVSASNQILKKIFGEDTSLPESDDADPLPYKWVSQWNVAKMEKFIKRIRCYGFFIKGSNKVFHQGSSVYETAESLCPTLCARSRSKGGIPYIVEGNRIRTITDCESMRIMGFNRRDTEAMRKAGLTEANIYHSAGDSICVTVLMAIFGSLLGMNDYEEKIKAHCANLANEE